MRNYLDVLKKIEETGAKVWLVGDTVRMIEMGVQPEVITLAIEAKDLYSVAMALGTGSVDARGTYPALRGEILGADFRAFTLRGSTIEEDLAHRDLSIEAIAIRSDGGVVDPFGGRFDIRNKVIRLTGDNVELINTDPLRILRMLRFAAELEMDIFWKTSSDVRNFLETHSDRMRDIPAERWGREILKGMQRRPYRFMSMCEDYGLVPFFLKELDDLRYIPDGKNTGLSIYDHVFNVLRIIEEGLDTNKEMQSDAFVLAGLLGHVGIKTLDGSDRTKQADRLINEYMTRWNIPSETINEVLAIIQHYKDFYKPISEKSFCRDVLEFTQEGTKIALQFAISVAIADGVYDEFREVLENNNWNLKQVMRRFNNVALQTEGSTRYLTGREVMSLLNMKPGKRVGELLEGLDMAVGTGKVSSRAAAEQWLKDQSA